MWIAMTYCIFFFSSRRRHTRSYGDWSPDVCSSDLNVGRSTLEMPGVLFMDMSISKNWNFTEQRFLQFRAEMFNIANRTNFGGLGSSNANAVQPFRSEERRVGKECINSVAT